MLNDSEAETIRSLLWIVQADEEIFTKVMSLFRQSRNDRQTAQEFATNLGRLLSQFGAK